MDTKILSKNLFQKSPSILTALAVGGLFTTVAMAITATPKAVKMAEEIDQDFFETAAERNIEYVKVYLSCYWPTIVMGAATVTCIVSVNNIHMRRNAALAAVYSLTEKALRDYQGKVVKTFGKKKEEAVRDELAQDEIDENPMDPKKVHKTSHGNSLCYDSLSGRYFRSDIEHIRSVQNTLNERLLVEMFISLNELYSDLELETIELGADIGWCVDHALLAIHFSSKLTKDGEPCVVLSYKVRPFAFNS